MRPPATATTVIREGPSVREHRAGHDIAPVSGWLGGGGYRSAGVKVAAFGAGTVGSGSQGVGEPAGDGGRVGDGGTDDDGEGAGVEAPGGPGRACGCVLPRSAAGRAPRRRSAPAARGRGRGSWGARRCSRPGWCRSGRRRPPRLRRRPSREPQSAMTRAWDSAWSPRSVWARVSPSGRSRRVPSSATTCAPAFATARACRSVGVMNTPSWPSFQSPITGTSTAARVNWMSARPCTLTAAAPPITADAATWPVVRGIAHGLAGVRLAGDDQLCRGGRRGFGA